MSGPTKKYAGAGKKTTGPSLPVILQQPQSHSLDLEHYNQTDLCHPSFKRKKQIQNCKQAFIFSRFASYHKILGSLGVYLNNRGIIINFKIETTRGRLIILRECTSKNLQLKKESTKACKNFLQHICEWERK